MELLFKTNAPNELKTSILSLIKEGDLKTWEIFEYENEKYIKHIKQWGDKGVIKMEVDAIKRQLLVRVIPYKNTEESPEDFEGYYLGRFCEIIFVNFPNSFTSIHKN